MDSSFKCSEEARSQALDFVKNETQFHLGFLPTEQSNPITASLERDFARSTLAGVECLQRGDRQIPITMRHVFASDKFARLVDAFAEALKTPGGRIVFSGCGATGRLSILLESMWREFFHAHAGELTAEERELADHAASIMTGGDFALIKSVEFFEDFAEGGARQAEALRVCEKDTFVAITEGGETSSVLGTLRYAADHGARCFLVFNNPADILRRTLERSRRAIEDGRVTVIDLYCGSMSLAGSTRMQATTSEQLLCSCALESALVRMMPRFATSGDYVDSFERLLGGLEGGGARRGIASAIDFEKGVYDGHGRITYFADECMLDLFTDNTERSPTFMLPQLKSNREKELPQSWAFVKNPMYATEGCWLAILRREPRCLEFSVDDARRLGMPRKFVDNPPRIGRADLMSYMIGREEAPERISAGARSVGVVVTTGEKPGGFMEAASKCAGAFPEANEIHIGPVPTEGIWIKCEIEESPLQVWRHLAVKLAFNCISTGTMVAMGRVAGNWMSWVSVSNKKLMDRGIRLLSDLGGIPYEEAAVRLFAAKEQVDAMQGVEVPSPVQLALREIRGR